MAKIKFKNKVRAVYNQDGTIAYEFIPVPAFTKNHCDMASFDHHPKYGGLTNSNLFPAVLRRIREERFRTGILRLDQIPEGVEVDTKPFLAVVTVHVK